jgi:DNA-binding transcriptional LysR family regulator
MAGTGLADLNALVAVATHRSFRAAAGELGITPSSLSYQIASLERRLGIRLLNRTTRSVSLTEAGETFLARVRPALRDIDDAIATVDRFRDTPAGLLRLNASEGGAERILPIVFDFMAAYPDMRVDLVTEGRLIDIVAAGFDAGLRVAQMVPRDMVSLPLGTDEAFIVVASPRYLATRGTPRTPPDLLAHECVRARLPSGALIEWEFERSGRESRVGVTGRLVVGSPDLSLRAARAGVGIAYVTRRSAERDLAEGKLVQLLGEWTPPFPGICLYYPQQRLTSAGLRAFIDHVQMTRRRGAKNRKKNTR